MEIVILFRDDGCRWSIEVSLKTESGRSSGSGSFGPSSWCRPKFFCPKGSEAEGSQKVLWSERNLIGPVTSVTGMYNPLGAGSEGGMHVNQKASIGAAPKLRRAKGS